MDPDPVGSKTYGSYSSGSATLLRTHTVCSFESSTILFQEMIDDDEEDEDGDGDDDDDADDGDRGDGVKADADSLLMPPPPPQHQQQPPLNHAVKKTMARTRTGFH
jgi:hypothetical protein